MLEALVGFVPSAINEVGADCRFLDEVRRDLEA
jgi:hypothetical protein